MKRTQTLGRTDRERVRQQFGDAALDSLLDAMAMRMQARTKSVSATASQNYLHGPGSMLGVLGMPATLTNAMILPVRGLQAELPYMRTDLEEQMFTIVTGETASSGSEPTANCADGKQPGNLKTCSQIWPFGRLQMDTQVLDVSMTGRLINRGEFIDQTLIGNPWGDFPQAPPLNPQQALRDDVSKKLLELWIALYRDYGHLNFNGNSINTAGSTGGFLEWNGLDRIVNTGHIDVNSGQLCPAADSMIRDFGHLTMNANAQLLVLTLSEMIRQLKYLADRTGQAPVDFAFAMRYSAFLKLTEVWPCAYFTTLCQASDLGGTGSGSTQFVNAEAQLELRKQMRDGMYIVTVFGDQVPVIIDDFITESATAGTFESTLYIVPLKVIGGRPATYFQFFNFDGPNAAVEQGQQMAPPGTFTTWAGGQYLVVKKMPTNTCVQIQVIKKQRLICETPFLAARLQNVKYVVTEHERGPLPTDPYYFVDGGSPYQYPPYFYPPL